LPAVQGQLTFRDAMGPTTYSARIVKYGAPNDLRFSWHGDLTNRAGQLAELVTDDGYRCTVVVDHGLLRPLEEEPSRP
jgi:hypothetical protein